MSKKEHFEQIERKVDASVKVLEETLKLYGKIRSKKEVTTQEINDLLKEIGANKEELKWVAKAVKSVKENPLDLEFIHVESGKKSADMAVNLLNAMAKTSPGRGYPSSSEMADTLGIKKSETRDKFEKGYQDTVEKLTSSHLSARQKTFNIWYWICMSMFGTMAFAVAALMLRRMYEWYMYKREEWAKWIMPEKSQLKKFSLWNWISKRTPPRQVLVPMFMQSE